MNTSTIPAPWLKCKNVTPRDLQTRLSRNETLQVIDVREFVEFAAGRIPGSRLLPLGEISAHANELDRGTPIVCICRSGKRSAEAAARLAELGFDDVAYLEGGLNAWEQSKLPLTRDSRAPWSLERQVRFALGVFVLTGLVLSLVWPGAIVVSWIIGVGMLLTSVIDWCGMAFVLAKAPWNKQRTPCCGK